MIIGLSGTQRSGKTTIARAYADKFGVQFIASSASACFAELGLDPQKTYDFKTRLDVQELILERFEAFYKTASIKHGAIADRTPLDLIAYTMADAVNDSVPEDQQERFAKYIDRCFEVLNKYFSFVMVVPPAIEFVPAEGKGVGNKAYLEHLHTLFRGLVVDDRMTSTKSYHLPRKATDLEDRITSLEWCRSRHASSALEQVRAHLENGGSLS